jgi:hypothetical protein
MEKSPSLLVADNLPVNIRKSLYIKAENSDENLSIFAV